MIGVVFVNCGNVQHVGVDVKKIVISNEVNVKKVCKMYYCATCGCNFETKEEMVEHWIKIGINNEDTRNYLKEKGKVQLNAKTWIEVLFNM